MDTCKIATFNLLTVCRDVDVVVVVVEVVADVADGGALPVQILTPREFI